MLYITTRGDRDAYTAYRTLCADAAPDNGFFLPMRFPCFAEEELRAFVNGSFEETVAYILNVFFSAGLTKWDVGLCVGRNTSRIRETSPKILISELWHNPGNSLSYVINGLYARILGDSESKCPSEWFRVAIKIAVWFGIYGELCRQNYLTFGEKIDISVPADDFSYPIAALYAMKAGLPLGNIICNCTDTQDLWSLIHRGMLIPSDVPNCLRAGIERFLRLRLDTGDVTDLWKKRAFEVCDENLANIREGLFCAISGPDRVSNAMGGIWGSNGQVVTPTAALCVAGLWDYRAKMGESRLTLVLEEDSPALHADLIEKATGIPKKKLTESLRD